MGRPCAALVGLVVWVACFGICQQAQAQAPSAATRVTTPDEFLTALEDPGVASIAVMKPMQIPSNWGPARISRQLLITSPFRAMVVWCDELCNAGKQQHPLIVLEDGAMVTFNRLFFRNYIPSSSAAYSNRHLDFINSPVPMIVSNGGQVTYNLVVLHWTASMLWVFRQPGSYWAQAAAPGGGMTALQEAAPPVFDKPDVYVIKKFSTDGSATIMDCYSPVDTDGCLTDQPFNTTLIYCPYTFKDSLRTPWVDRVLVFHDIGMDRLVNSYRDPVRVNRTITYVSCPGTHHTIELDNITNSVLVVAGGSLTFKDLIVQVAVSRRQLATVFLCLVTPLLVTPLLDSGGAAAAKSWCLAGQLRNAIGREVLHSTAVMAVTLASSC
eukprot:gene6920-7138_t